MSDVSVELKEFNVEFDDTNTSKSANIVSGHDIKESFATIHKRLNNIGYTWGTERTIIDSNADLDNYKTPGIYEMISSSYTITHSPIDDKFRMYVMSVGNATTAQYYIPENYDCIYTRKYGDIFETWSDWKRLGEQVILSYGNSTWDDFYNAYKHNAVVYCRASSNTNPATGSQTRMAFMAYVNNGTDPTEVEFQYYRSVSSHSDSQQGDQVYVYKLVKNSGWSVTTREASSKIAVTSPIAKSYSSGTITLSHTDSGVTAGTYDSVTVDAKGHVTAGTNYQQAEIDYAINTGVKNILKITERYKEHNGVTFTVNSDESVSISGGTTSQNSFIRLTGSQSSTDYTDQVPIPKGKYKISCPKATSTDTFVFVIGYRESSSDTRHTLQANSGNDFTNEFEITTDTGRFDATLLSYSTESSYSATVYPMVMSAEITNNAFAPYAPTNRELYEDKATVDDIFGVKASLTAGIDLNNLTTPGKYVCSGATVAAQLLHCPTTTNGFIMLVDYVANVSRIIQRIYSYNTTNGNFRVFYRSYISTGWTDWQRGLTDATLDEIPTANSTNAVMSGGVQAPLAELVDSGAKNLLNLLDNPIDYHSSHTTNVNTGTIVETSSGTYARTSIPTTLPAGDYVFSCNITLPSGECRLRFNTDSDGSSGTAIIQTIMVTSSGSYFANISLSTETSFYVILYNNSSSNDDTRAITYSNLMICAKHQWDISNTYQPYALPNSELTASEIELVDNGAKNKFSGSYTSQTLNGVAFTVNSDGTITANRSSSSSSAANLPSTNFVLKPGTYVFSSASNSQRDTTFDSYVYNIDTSTTIARDNPNDSPGNVFTITQDTTVRVNVRVASGYDASNLIFSPMICTLAEWNVSKKFVPYTLTNRELFESIQNNDNIISGYVSDNTGTTKTVITSGVNATKSVKDGTIAYITFKEDNTAIYTDITTTGISLSVNGTTALISEIGNECYDYDNTSTVSPAVGSIDTMYIEANPRYGLQGCTNLYIYKDFGNNNTKWMYLCSTGLDLWSFYNFTGISGVLRNIYIGTNSSGYSVDIKGNTIFPFALATCDTSATAQNKVASVSQSTWTRKVGCIVAVKYANTNTYSSTTASPVTLNINGTGAANIYYGSNATPTGTNTAAFGYAGRYTYYVWDGTYWVWLSQSTDNNTTYSAITQANITNGSGTSSGLITGQRAKQAVDKFAFGTNTQITSGSNFDSYTTVGVYYVASDSDATNITHCPVEYHGRLEVITTKSDSNIMQIYYANISGIDCPQIFVRVRATNWGGWVTLNGQSVGIHLSTGDDLDNIVNPGIYQCGTVTKAKSLLHTPFADATTSIGQTGYNAAAFKFIVENVNSPTTLKQTIIPLYGNSTHFERTRLSGVWSTWYAFSGTAVI